MMTIKGVIQNGQVILEQSTNWPDGTEVTIVPAYRPETSAADDNSMSTEEIAQTLAAMDKIEPFEMSDQERADIEAWRQKVKAYTLANMHQGIEELFP